MKKLIIIGVFIVSVCLSFFAGNYFSKKENMKLRKLKVRGKNRVLREICLFCLGYNLNRLIQRGKTNKKGTTLHPLKRA